MECAGIIEAGGVKNVTYSLCKEVYELNHKSTLFIPLFKTTSYTFINDLKKNVYSAKINHCGKDESVQYHTAVFSDGGFNIVFVDHPCFNQKEGVAQTPFSKAEQCPTNEQPLIIKIDSKNKAYHMHGAAQYDGVVVDSDGEEKNTTNTGKVRPSNEEL